MSHQQIQLAFNLSLYVLLPAGFALMLLWTVKVAYPKSKARLEAMRSIGVRTAGMVTWFYMLPGLSTVALFFIPAGYFGHLLKQEDYCRELIRVNRLRPDDAILRERCGALDIPALFAPVSSDRGSRFATAGW